MPANTQLQQQFVTHLLQSSSPSDDSSFSGQTADRASLLSCIAQINVEMGEISDQLVGLISNNADSLQQLLSTSTELAGELADLFGQANTLALPLDGTNGIKNELVQVLQQQTTLEKDIEQENSIIQMLQLLSKFQEQLEQFQIARTAMKFCNALDSLDAMQLILSQANTIDQIDIISLCRDRIRQLHNNLVNEIEGAFTKMIRFNTEGKSVELIVDIQKQGHLDDTVYALFRLNALPTRMDIIVRLLLRNMIQPLLHRQNSGLNEQSNAKTHVLTLQLNDESLNSLAFDKVVEQSDTLYKNIQKIIEFILNTLTRSENEEVSRQIRLLFSTAIVNPLYELLVSDYLQAILPVDSASLKLFDKINQQTRQFENSFKELGFNIGPNSQLIQFTKQNDKYYAQKKHRHCLQQARKLLSTYDFTSVKLKDVVWQLRYTNEDSFKAVVLTENRASNTPGTLCLPQDPFNMPVCLVSTSIIQLKQAIETIVEEACQLASPDGAKELLLAVRQMAELFQALVPQQQSRILESVPALAMQFHNDCMLLAHLMLVLDLTYRSYLPTDTERLAIHFTDLVPLLRQLGQVYFNRTLTYQQKALFEAYNELNGLHDAGENERYEKIQQTILQTVYQLRKLSDVWKSTLPRPLHDRAIGQLIDCLLMRITNDILKLADISANESYQLHKACQMLFELANLFVTDTTKEHHQTPPPHYVPSWTKFRQLLCRYYATIPAHLLDVFSLDELTTLLCALFSDTPLRKKNLEEISTARSE
ncbi:Centromere/kinetochore Zw10-domain-containing protein [Syncephalis fuscata]|nr:Centromere/kinetochore Zw10-domain-containing protein [Syncephalis fuscata]